ncbi:rhomboid-like protein [Streptomyces formicae]|uniref:Uncharacterized protein n=1 Tax=Streptomyces formicae TaxID=1616117 RepID=A0A291QG62_9ACTN|nr:rhomboid-like protein [Streptomyces formicae]ATL30435.1 hypothetical protein KY5_5417 [Streptomyces formicae]
MNQSVKSAEVAPGSQEDPAPHLNGIPAQPPPADGRVRERVYRDGPALAQPEPSAHSADTRGRTVTAAKLRPRHLLPTPKGTPFTFVYALVLVATSLLTEYADPDLVYSLLQGSSTDVTNLAHAPALVLVASALWIAGGITSPYAIGFLLVLTALERRIGAWRTAGVFLLGHGVATLATEIPVGLSVLAGHLPDSSLHRLDYGISFGVAASVGALAGLLAPWLRWIVLAGFGLMLIDDLVAFADPMTNWGHLLALLIGVATWPLLRRARQSRAPSGRAPHEA